MAKNEKQISEKLLLDFLRALDDGFSPVRISVIETEKRASESANRVIDALVDVT